MVHSSTMELNSAALSVSEIKALTELGLLPSIDPQLDSRAELCTESHIESLPELQAAESFHVSNSPSTQADDHLISISHRFNYRWLISSSSDIIYEIKYLTPPFKKEAAEDHADDTFNLLKWWNLYFGCVCSYNVLTRVLTLKNSSRSVTDTITECIQRPNYIKDLVMSPVYVFVDISNLVMGCQWVDKTTQLKVDELHKVVVGLRYPKRLIARGYIKKKDDPIGSLWKNLNYEVMTTRVVSDHDVSFVDKSLITEIGSLLLARSPQPGKKTIILMSGDDGNRHDGASNFEEFLIFAMQRSWNIEVWSWEITCSNTYKNWSMNPDKFPLFKLVLLDQFRERITKS